MWWTRLLCQHPVIIIIIIIIHHHHHHHHLRLYAEYATKQSWKAARAWNLHALVPEPSSLLTETAYRDGATKRGTQFVNFVCRRYTGGVGAFPLVLAVQSFHRLCFPSSSFLSFWFMTKISITNRD